MDFLPSAGAVAFRAEVRDLIASAFTDEVREQVHETGTIHSWPLHRAIGERGWIAQALPEAQGGGGRDPEELAALFAELERAGAPYDGLSNVVMVSSVLAHVGNEMIRAEVLPRLLSGEAMVCLGYTEPDSGSDVAAARTRAVRDGDDWRIDGQKMFTSVAEEADWIFLLTRTSSEGAKHAGLTFFLVPMDTPGISLQEVRTLPGKRVNITFLDDVRIGDEWRVGEIDSGWQVMLVALSFERGLAGGVRDGERLLRMLDDLAKRENADGERADRRSRDPRAAGAARDGQRGGRPAHQPRRVGGRVRPPPRHRGRSGAAVRERVVHARRELGARSRGARRIGAPARPRGRCPRLLRALLPVGAG